MEATAQAPAETSAPRTLQSLMTPQSAANIVPGYGSLVAFDLLQRQAKALASSSLVPAAYQSVIVKYDRDGNETSRKENPQAIPNTMIALNMATRMNADPVMVMQNLYVVEGRPSWSSQWVIAQINNCGRFEPLRFDLIEKGEITAKHEYTEWSDDPQRPGRRKATDKTKEIKVDNIECIAWTVPKGTKVPQGVVTLDDARKAGLPVLKGPKVSVAMAVAEGWYTKKGSKWQTIPELMLHYRAGAFFGRLYAPELLMGFPTQDEAEDMRSAAMLQPNEDGTYGPSDTPAPTPAPSPESLRRRASDKAVDAAPKPQPEAPAAETPAAETPAASAPAAEPAASPAAEPEATAPAATPAPASAGKPTAAQEAGDMFGSVD